MLLRLMLRGIAGPLRGTARILRNVRPFLGPFCTDRGACLLPPVALPGTNFSRITAEPRGAPPDSCSHLGQGELDWLHPTAESLKAYRAGTLGEREDQRIKVHLASCALCRSDDSFLGMSN